MIVQQLEKVWHEVHAWPGYLQAMHALLSGFSPKSQKGLQLLEKWASLPGLCCQAVGGQAEWADELAIAWLAFYGAAYVMDSVEDGDKPGADWAWMSPGMTVNAASGLYFTASVILNDIKKNPRLERTADELIADFYRGFLIMCGGQHHDLYTPHPSIDDYWEIAASKSGTFFAIACKSGARLATEDEIKLRGFYDFGQQLGLLIQILDDIDDIQKAPGSDDWAGLYKTLPLIYALCNAKPKARARLETLLNDSEKGRRAGEELLDIIDGTGAVQYLLNEYDCQRKKAVAALHQAGPLPKCEERLLTLLPHIRK